MPDHSTPDVFLYAHPDADTGNRLDVDRDEISIMGPVDDPDRPNLLSEGRSVSTPRGDEAVGLARAILTAAGNTGHRVISEADLARYVYAGEEKGALSMRERSIDAAMRTFTPLSPDNIEQRVAIVDMIRALPLIDSDDIQTEPASVHVATPEGITPCGQGTRDVTTAALIDEITCVGCLQALAIEKGGEVIAMRDERDRVRVAWESARRGRAQAREDAGMERFFARAAEADVIRLRKELRSESARVSAARNERDQALQAARETTTTEELGRIVDDSVEIGAQSMREWVARLDRKLSETRKVVTQRLATVETHLGLTDVQEAQLSAPMSDAARLLSEIRERVQDDIQSDRILSQEQEDRSHLLGIVDHLRAKHAETHATSMRRGERMVRAEAELANREESPARYRDRAGDLWEERPNGILETIAVNPQRPGDLGITLPRVVAERQYGPLTPVTNTGGAR